MNKETSNVKSGAAVACSALLGQFAIELKNDPPDGTELWGAYESEALAREVATAFIAHDSTWRVVPVTTDMEFSGCPM